MQDPVPEKLADDLIEGVPAFCEWSGFKPRAAYHMVRTRQIPFTKIGSKLIFRKSECSRRLSGEQNAA